MDVAALSAIELIAAYESRTLSPVEALDVLAARIEALEPALNAFVTLDLERARRDAAAAERAYGRGRAGPLAGVPVGVKDVYDTAGLRTTYGSAIFRDHVPAEDAEVVRRARAAGAVVVGKTGTHEFAWGITSVNGHYGSPRNPWSADRISGGSSGGSGVALAAGGVPLAFGSDTGGSTRVPAAFCGVVGLKPSFGVLSTAGLWPLAPSLDHVGLMARSPVDAAAFLEALSPGAAAANRAVAGLVVARCPQLEPVPLTPAVEAGVEAAAGALAQLGARTTVVELDGGEALTETFGTVQHAEALLVHERAGLFPQRAGDYGADVRGRLEAATRVTLGDYADAVARRRRLEAAAVRLFERADLVLSPVAAISAPPFGVDEVEHLGRRRPVREAIMASTPPHDLLGLPSCALRAGFDADGLPVGVQLAGAPGADGLVLAAAQALFEATPDVQARRPQLGAVDACSRSAAP